MAKTVQDYQKEFKKYFPSAHNEPWNYAGAFTHVLKPYIIEHAEDIFEKSQYSQVLANEKGYTDPHTRIKLSQAIEISQGGTANNTLWAVETVIIKAFLDLASFSPAPDSHYPPGITPPILAKAAVFYSNNAPAPPGTPVWRSHASTQGIKYYVPNLLLGHIEDVVRKFVKNLNIKVNSIFISFTFDKRINPKKINDANGHW